MVGSVSASPRFLEADGYLRVLSPGLCLQGHMVPPEDVSVSP